MLMETEQQSMTEMPHESQFQVRANSRAGVWRLKDTRMHATTMTDRHLRQESWHDNASVEWLSTSIVHDLRNPLGAIYAAAEILIDLDPATTQVQRLATNIFRAAGRMRELLANLNSVALGNTPTPEMCNIREVITAAASAAWQARDSRSVQFVIE